MLPVFWIENRYLSYFRTDIFLSFEAFFANTVFCVKNFNKKPFWEETIFPWSTVGLIGLLKKRKFYADLKNINLLPICPSPKTKLKLKNVFCLRECFYFILTYLWHIVTTVNNYANRPKNKRMFRNSFKSGILTCRGEKNLCTVIYNMIQCTAILQKSLFWFVVFSPRMWTSLHSSPMLWFNCPISHKTLYPLIPTLSFTYVTQFQTGRRQHQPIGNLLGPIQVRHVRIVYYVFDINIRFWFFKIPNMS